MLKKKKLNKITFFQKFLLSYLFILIIPLVISSYAYSQALTIVKDDAVRSRIFMLKNIKENIDKYFTDIDENIVNAGLDAKLTRLMNYNQPNEGSTDMFWFFDYASSKKLNSISNKSFDSSYFILLKNNESVFSNTRTSFGFNEFYNDYFTYSNMTYSQWYDIYFNSYHYKKVFPSINVKINGVEKPMITYLYSIPLNQHFIPNGVIALLIDGSEINKLLKEVNVDNQCYSYITDTDGNLVTSSSIVEPIKYNIDNNTTEGFFYKKISGKEMLVVYTKSSYNGWTYTAVLPVNTVLGNVYYIRQISIIVAIASLFVGIIVALLLSYSNSKIFKDLKKTLKDFFENDTSKEKNIKSDYEIIHGGVANLITNNKEIQISLQTQAHVLKSIFIDRLLKGEFDNRHKMETLASHVGLELIGSQFAVCIIKINPQDNIISPQILEELDVFRALIENILKRAQGEYCFVHIINENEIGIILSFTENSKEDNIRIAHNIMLNVSNEVLSQYHITPKCGIGNIYANIMDIHYSFNEAKQALNYLDYKSVNNAMVIWYKDISKEVNFYYYPNELEQKLINFAKSGNWEELESTLNRIFDENMTKNPISDPMWKLMFFDMQATFMKLVDEVQYKQEAFNQNFELLSREKPEIFLKWIKESYYKVCRFTKSNKKSHNTTLKEKILTYINSNYTDGNLSVCLVASHFNLSESYFSQFFKEQTGETFSNYLESLRINLACKLIREGSITIDQIAQRTGYNNTNSFRRAFKKVTGVVPSSFS